MGGKDIFLKNILFKTLVGIIADFLKILVKKENSLSQSICEKNERELIDILKGRGRKLK